MFFFLMICVVLLIFCFLSVMRLPSFREFGAELLKPANLMYFFFADLCGSDVKLLNFVHLTHYRIQFSGFFFFYISCILFIL